MKFNLNPFQSRKAKDDRRGAYSRIPDNSDSSPRESHELAGDIAQAVTASGSQPGPSGHSRSTRLGEAEALRAQARRKVEEREELLEQAEKARALGELSLAEKLFKLAKQCWKAMKWLNRKAASIIYMVKNWNAKPGEVNLHLLHVPEAIEAAKKKIQEAMSREHRTIRFIRSGCGSLAGKGKHSEDGPKILPAAGRARIEAWTRI